MWVYTLAHLCQRGRGLGVQGMCVDMMSISLESTAKQNCGFGEGPNYGVTWVQCAALSTADQTLLMGHASAKEHVKTQGGLLDKYIITSVSPLLPLWLVKGSAG